MLDSVGANTKIESLSDVLRHKMRLTAICRCGHKATLDTEKLYRYYLVRGWDVRKHMLGDHICCSRCRSRPTELRVTHLLPDGPDWGPRTEDQWKALVKRMRG